MVEQWLGQHPPWEPRRYWPNCETGPRQSYDKTISVHIRFGRYSTSWGATAQDFGGKRPVYRPLEPQRLAVEFRDGRLRRREAAFDPMHQKFDQSVVHGELAISEQLNQHGREKRIVGRVKSYHRQGAQT